MYASRTGCYSRDHVGKVGAEVSTMRQIATFRYLARVSVLGNTRWCSVGMQHSVRNEVTDFGGDQLWGEGVSSAGSTT